jgi:geranylgeranyl reductase family protein
MPDPDVIVVGGGPAGATAARALAAAGARVCVLDRARFPRNKPCGGAISMRALGRFPHLAEHIERIPSRRLSRLYLEGPAGAGVALISHAPAALMVRRVEFDLLLLQLAREAGAEVMEGVEISRARETDAAVELGARDGRSFRAAIVIAADGVNSVVARRLGLNPGWPAGRVAIDMMEETPVAELRSPGMDALWVAYGYGAGEGYAYVFPKNEHVNVGVGFVLDWFRQHTGQVPYEIQRSFVSSLKERGVLDGASSRRHFTPFLIPVGGPLARTASRRVLLVGDAGGFVNGITAEGIYYAMVTGDLAAAAVVRGETAGYERAWRREIGSELRDAVLVQRYLLTAPARIDALVDAARRRPHLTDLLVRHAMGEVPYATARRRVLLGAPLTALRLVLEALRPRPLLPQPSGLGTQS